MRPLPAILVWCIVYCMYAPPVRAEDGTPPAASPAPAQECSACDPGLALAERSLWKRLIPRFSIGGSNALFLYGSLGVLYAAGETPSGMIFLAHSGPFLELSAGMQGLHLDAGYGVSSMGGYDLHIAYLRGWGDEREYDGDGLPDAHFIGGGVHVRFLLARFHLRLFWHVAGDTLDVPGYVPVVEVAVAIGM